MNELVFKNKNCILYCLRVYRCTCIYSENEVAANESKSLYCVFSVRVFTVHTDLRTFYNKTRIYNAGTEGSCQSANLQYDQDLHYRMMQIGRAMRKHVFGYMWTAKAQISLPIRAIWSGPRCPLTELSDTTECSNREQKSGWYFAQAWDESEFGQIHVLEDTISNGAVHIQSTFNGSNIFGTIENCSRHG